MKQIITSLCLLLFVSMFPTFAQLNSINTNEPPQKEINIRKTYSYFGSWKNNYIISTNENHEGFMFGLGKNKNEAKLTIKDLIQFASSKQGTSQNVLDSFGYETNISVQTILGKQYLSLSRKNKKNHIYDEDIIWNITIPELEKVQNYLESSNKD